MSADERERDAFRACSQRILPISGLRAAGSAAALGMRAGGATCARDAAPATGWVVRGASAATTAGERAAGSVAASDAFFPFADGPQILLDAGVRAIVQPGGSVRDEETIAAANAAGVTMYFTGERHFFH